MSLFIVIAGVFIGVGIWLLIAIVIGLFLGSGYNLSTPKRR